MHSQLSKLCHTIGSASSLAICSQQDMPHPICCCRVQLLALSPPQQQQSATRGGIYAATILQQTALLLQLLISDSLLLLIPAPVVPAHVLQLLHVLPKVQHQLTRQIETLQKKHTTATARKERQQQQQHDIKDGKNAEAEAAAMAQVQGYEQLLELLHKPPTQLHVVLQVGGKDTRPFKSSSSTTTMGSWHHGFII